MTNRPWLSRTRCVRLAGSALVVALAGCAPEAPAGPVPGNDPPGPAALAEADSDVPHLSVALLDVVRVSAGIVEVRFAFSTAADAPGPTPIARYLSSAPADAGSIADVFLVDEVAQKKYFVVRDAARRPVSSRDLDPLPPGASRVLWARVAAPPPGIQAVGVQIPHVPLFGQVPITGPAEDRERRPGGGSRPPAGGDARRTAVPPGEPGRAAPRM